MTWPDPTCSWYSLPGKLSEQNQKFTNLTKQLAIKDEQRKTSMVMSIDFLNIALDNNKLNASLLKHPKFSHLEKLLNQRNILSFKTDILGGL